MKQEVEQVVIDPEEFRADIMEDDFAFQRELDRGSGGEDLSFSDNKVLFVAQKILKLGVVHDYQDAPARSRGGPPHVPTPDRLSPSQDSQRPG